MGKYYKNNNTVKCVTALCWRYNLKFLKDIFSLKSLLLFLIEKMDEKHWSITK